MERRVVITACSAISPIGYGRKAIVESLLNGVSGVAALREDELISRFIHSRVYGTVGYPMTYDFSRQYRKTMGPVAYYACQVAKDVLEQAGLPREFVTGGRLGIAFGSIHGSPTVQRDIYRIFFEAKDKAAYQTIGAVDYLKSMVHTTAVNISKMFGITGRIISSGTACTTASQSIGFGYEAVKYGLQDAMICGGADEYDTICWPVPLLSTTGPPGRPGRSTERATAWWSPKARAPFCSRNTSLQKNAARPFWRKSSVLPATPTAAI